MNRVILCEGKTDAILLSYYLKKIAGWLPVRYAPKNLAFKTRKKNENIDWYKKADEMLMICGVGGKDNFQKFFSRDIEKAIYAVNAFSRIAIITDRDNRSIEDIECSVQREFSPFFSSTKNQEWKTNTYIDDFGIEKTVESMVLIIPTHQQGALETVLLSAISENPYDAKIVSECGSFVEKIRPDAAEYISTDRLQLKAHLSTVWAIQSPEKVFDFINDQIDAVAWEKYETLRKCFGAVETI